MILNKKLMDDLSAQAKENPRLRQAFDLRTTPNDSSQRILNAVEPGTILPSIATEALQKRLSSFAEKKCNTIITMQAIKQLHTSLLLIPHRSL